MPAFRSIGMDVGMDINSHQCNERQRTSCKASFRIDLVIASAIVGNKFETLRKNFNELRVEASSNLNHGK